MTLYWGRVAGRDYMVRARHGRFDTWASVIIDGVYHEPSREKEPRTRATSVGRGAREAAGGEVSGEVDGLAFRVEETMGKVVYTVLRPGEDGDLEDAEQICVRTAGLGGKGEVEVRGSADPGDLSRTPLVPEKGSDSWEREKRRLAHPVRFSLISALAAAAKYLIPLLGLGALLDGWLRPVTEPIERALRPPVKAVGRLLKPLVEAVDALLDPLRRALDWLWSLLFGWLPEFAWELPFEVPSWVVDVAIPVLVVLGVFVAALVGLRRRSTKLAAALESEDRSG